MTLEIGPDLEIVNQLDVPDRLETSRAPVRWTSQNIELRPRRLTLSELQAVFAEAGLRRGWLVQTDAISYFDGTTWLTRDNNEVTEPWHRVLQAELAFDLRSVRITLLRDREWHCEEVTEGAGKPCLASIVSHVAVGHPAEWQYRVYWRPQPATPGEADVMCYQPIACRLLAEGQ